MQIKSNANQIKFFPVLTLLWNYALVQIDFYIYEQPTQN